MKKVASFRRKPEIGGMRPPSERVYSEKKVLRASGGKRRGVGHAGKDNRLRVGAPSADSHCNVPSPQNPPWSDFSQPHAHPPRASACRYTHRGHLSAGAHARASCLWPHAGARLTSAITAAGLRVRPWRPSTAWTASRVRHELEARGRMDHEQQHRKPCHLVGPPLRAHSLCHLNRSRRVRIGLYGGCCEEKALDRGTTKHLADPRRHGHSARAHTV